MTYPNVSGIRIRVDDVRVSAVCLSGLTVSGGVRAGHGASEVSEVCRHRDGLSFLMD